VVGSTVEPAAIRFSLDVSKGYYVRSFARDMGERLGVPAHLRALRRDATGPFTAARGVPWDSPREVLVERLVGIAEAASTALPTAELRDECVAKALQGQRMVDDHFVRPPSVDLPVRGSMRGTLIAIGDRSRWESHRASRVFRSAGRYMIEAVRPCDAER
jgi:tRNA pseudouridine55 synthase